MIRKTGADFERPGGRQLEHQIPRFAPLTNCVQCKRDGYEACAELGRQRRAVLDPLRQGSLPAGQIARAFPVSRPAISKHLRMLRCAQLVQERREGRHRIYELDAVALKAVDLWLSRYRSFWQANLNGLKAFVERQHPKEKSARKERKK